MAMVPCAKCNNEISDQAVACPACGHEVGKEVEAPKESGVCTACGVALEAEAAFCSSCGCPVAKEEEAVEETAVVAEGETGAEEAAVAEAPMVAGKSKKPLIIILVLALILGVAGVMISEQQKKAKAEALEAYYNTMLDATHALFAGWYGAESTGNIVTDVWYCTIYQVEKEGIDRHTKVDGQFRDDFNDSLNSLYSDVNFIAILDKIKEDRGEAEEVILSLETPPEEYEASYEALVECYGLMVELTDMVISPQGSFKSYSEEFGEVDKAVGDAYNKAQDTMDEQREALREK